LGKLIAKFQDANSNDGLAAIVEEVLAFGKKQVSAMAKPKALSVPPHSHQINSDPALGSPVSSGSNRAPNTRNELKTAAELAAMIEADLRSTQNAPRAVSTLRSYGAKHWRPMLTITPAAGRIREPQKWRDLTDELAERLRQRYDLAW
jgi:hypothetical protein